MAHNRSLGRELRRRRRARRRELHVHHDRRRARRRSATRSRRTCSRSIVTTRRSRARASRARTGWARTRWSCRRPSPARRSDAGSPTRSSTRPRRPWPSPTARSRAATSRSSSSYDPAGLTDEQLAKFPHLADYAVLRPVGLDRDEVASLLTEQLAGRAAPRRRAHRASPACSCPACSTTSTPTPRLDAARRDRGRATTRRSRLWAPTAQSVSLEVWDAGATGDPERHRRRVRRRPTARGASTALGRRRVPLVGRGLRADDGQDRDNSVTDPYSVALTTNSARIGRRRPRRRRRSQPEQWAETPAPVVERPGRPCDLRAARARLLDHRRVGARGGARHLPCLHARLGGHGAAASSSPMPASTPCTCCRRSTSPRSRRTAPRRRRPPATSRRSVPHRPSSRRASTAIRDLDGFNWGYDPFHFQAPEGSYAVDPNGGARVARVPRDGRRPARHGPAGRARRGVQPHRGIRPG